MKKFYVSFRCELSDGGNSTGDGYYTMPKLTEARINMVKALIAQQVAAKIPCGGPSVKTPFLYCIVEVDADE